MKEFHDDNSPILFGSTQGCYKSFLVLGRFDDGLGRTHVVLVAPPLKQKKGGGTTETRTPNKMVTGWEGRGFPNHLESPLPGTTVQFEREIREDDPRHQEFQKTKQNKRGFVISSKKFSLSSTFKLYIMMYIFVV